MCAIPYSRAHPVLSSKFHQDRSARYRATHREALSASPFRSPKADFSASGSMPPGTPQSFFPMEPVSRNGLSLACNDCSLSEATIPGSTVPACYFATRQLVPRPVRLQLPRLHWFAPVEGGFFASGPLQFTSPTRSAASPASAPLQDFYIPRDRSVQQIPPPCGSPSESARFPLAPRCRFYF
jgi:hypothetical protein